MLLKAFECKREERDWEGKLSSHLRSSFAQGWGLVWGVFQTVSPRPILKHKRGTDRPLN